MMKNFRNAEEVLEFYIYNVRMGTYDKKFMLNLQTSKVLMRQAITSNQAALFKKVVKKYHKQVSQVNLDATQLSEIPWSLSVVDSSIEFTQAHLKIEDDKLIVYSPYKSEFVKDFRSANLMVWNRAEKRYTTEFGLRTLKLALDIICKHYTEINVCNNIQSILDDLKQYEDAVYWTPTLVKSKTGNLYIAASNQALDHAMKNLELKVHPYNISKLVGLGVAIVSEQIWDSVDSPKINSLICSTLHEVNWDENEFESLEKFLNEICISHIVVVNGYATLSKDYTEQFKKFKLPYKYFNGIKEAPQVVYALNDLRNENVALIRLGKFGTANNIGKKFVSKIINIIDNTPVSLYNETM